VAVAGPQQTPRITFYFFYFFIAAAVPAPAGQISTRFQMHP
jgi:hypothetical protein